MLPYDLPDWTVAYQHARRWMQVWVFEEIAHDLRMILRLVDEREAQPSATILDGRTLQPTPESGARAGYDGAKKNNGSKVHAAVATLGNLLALKVTSADEQERAQVAELAAQVQQVTGGTVEVALVDQGYTGERGRASRRTRHSPGGGQAHGSEEGIRAVAPEVGGRVSVAVTDFTTFAMRDPGGRDGRIAVLDGLTIAEPAAALAMTKLSGLLGKDRLDQIQNGRHFF